MRQINFLSALFVFIIFMETLPSTPSPEWQFAANQTHFASDVAPALNCPILDQSQTTSYGGSLFWAQRRLKHTFTPIVFRMISNLQTFSLNWPKTVTTQLLS